MALILRLGVNTPGRTGRNGTSNNGEDDETAPTEERQVPKATTNALPDTDHRQGKQRVRSADSNSTGGSDARTNHAPYRRSGNANRHAGSDADGDCQDARQKVLVAESRSTVSYRTDRGCRVAAGQWLAPYTNTVVTDLGKLDVDHMVPLGNAHLSGAWQWSTQQKERYANHLEDPQHLIAVTASANRSKGARGPEAWKPEDQSYWCQYAIDWITIKDDWNLTVTLREIDALTGMLDTCANPPNLLLSQGGTPVDPRVIFQDL